MFPPDEVHDAARWDEYWKRQLADRFVLGFIDMCCNDEALVRAMHQEGMQSVLCVGSGLSLEPHALIEAGFRVTALDLSPLATRVAGSVDVPAEHADRFFP